MTGMSDAAFAAMERRSAERAIAAHCEGFAYGMCEACGERPARDDGDFCTGCVRGVPGLLDDPFEPIGRAS
ncbi:hypothetical protein [Tsukamurella tyrosinosolvens]|uniref:hypothetical protein n=1 Tax=Tsukamurella tyrosinosolvens TaxID=57704 RepID=UPI002DD43CE3|nr:hypothetical protein [Tsukamurella tyrosinosolvens]MEC4616286.1 hypothetical protein [Tsukamurella tyrosinosolvens]